MKETEAEAPRDVLIAKSQSSQNENVQVQRSWILGEKPKVCSVHLLHTGSTLQLVCLASEALLVMDRIGCGALHSSTSAGHSFVPGKPRW